jgi:hypothetical protein
MSPVATPFAALLEAFATRFVNRTRPYAMQERDGTYRWDYQTLGIETIAAHVRGELTLALSSSDEAGRCRWLCLDVDTADGLARLLQLRAVLAERGLPGLVEASRRGGHLWLFLECPLLASTAALAVLVALQDARAAGTTIPEIELFPDAATMHATLGHAVRLPLGIHRLTGRRYALFDEYGLPCAFTSTAAALRFVLAWPHVDLSRFLALAARSSEIRAEPGRSHDERVVPGREQESREGKIGTRSGVIRWVDAEISQLDLLDELAPNAEMRRQGKGYLGWCPFHDDRAPDEHGRPGTPSFYVVQDRRYGWSWRCLSTNCAQHHGPMRHSFRLLQELLATDVRGAIRAARARWPEADSTTTGVAS